MSLLDKLKAKSNTGIVLRNTMLSAVIKGASLMLALFTTPAYMRFFDNSEVLGVWFTLLSVLAWILNCDMGIGNGLRNQLVYAINERDWGKAKKYISSSYLFLSVIGAFVLVAVLIVGKFVSWNVVFNISTDIVPAERMTETVQVLLASIILQLILRLVTSILYALQEAFIPSLLNLCTTAFMLVFVLLANRLGKNNSLVLLAGVYLFAVNFPLIIATLWVFLRKLPESRPTLNCFRKNYAISVLKIGIAFLWLQLIAMVVDNTNNYLITLFIGNSAVVEYQLYNRIFSLPITMLMLLITPLWSAITKAKAENDWNWIAASYKKFLKTVALVGMLEFALILPLQWIFDIWLGDKTIPVDYQIAVVFALSGTMMCLRTVISSYSNGLCELKIQMVYMTLGAVVNIPLAYIFSKEMGSYSSIIIANIVSIIPYCIAQMVWCHRTFQNRTADIHF